MDLVVATLVAIAVGYCACACCQQQRVQQVQARTPRVNRRAGKRGRMDVPAGHPAAAAAAGMAVPNRCAALLQGDEAQGVQEALLQQLRQHLGTARSGSKLQTSAS